MNTTLGTLLCAAGGLAGATFALPFRGIRTKSYESYWFVYALIGLIVFPLVLATVTCPNIFGLLGNADGVVLARCIGFGALWGLGGLTWGLMIRYLGIGLGLAIGCGLCSATGTLIPPIVTGHAGDLFKDTAAIVTFVSVLVSLIGIVLVGLAGKLKEGELSEEAKKKAVAEFDFKKGMLVALFSGIASAGMNFGLQGGASLEAAAQAAGVDAKWIGMPVLVVVLWGGFLVNAAWCLWQNAKNKTFGDYFGARAAKGPRGEFLLAALAGVIWACQFACQKIGEPAMGEIRYISFAVVMGSCVLFSSLLGVFLGEWKGTSTKTRGALLFGLIVLAASIGLAVVAKTVGAATPAACAKTRVLPAMPALADRPVTATAVFKAKGGKTLFTRTLQPVRRADGGVAFTVKCSDLSANVADVEIHSTIATARKGDSGFALCQRGLLYRFGKDDLKVVQPHGWLYMPYYAMKTTHDTFIAVMEGMRFEHDLCLIAEKGVYTMFPRWKIAEIGSAPYEDMTVVFYQLPLDADYNAMAKVYRSYKFAHDPTVRTLKERIRERPHLQTLADSVALRQNFAVKPFNRKTDSIDFTPANEHPVRTITTYDATLKLLQELKAAGVENVALCVAGYQTGGYDGRCPTVFPVEEGPGGEAGIKRLCEGGRTLGYIIDAHDNYTDCFSCSPQWNEGAIACKKPDGSLYTNGAWSGGKAHNLCLKNAWETFLPADLERIRALGFWGCHYIDVFTAVQPYRCCDPKHPANTKEQAAYQRKIAVHCQELFGGFSSECCVDHLLGYVDYINYVCAPMRGKRQAEAAGKKSSIDAFVPFFELAFHDVVLSNPDKITQEVLKQPENLLLVEYGGRPIFYHISRSNFDGVVAAWKQFKALRHLMTEEMVSHRELTQGVVCVTYGNGEKIIVNHTAAAYTAAEGVVPAQDFRLFK